METKETKERMVRPAVVFGLCGALLAGMLLGSVAIPWMAAKIDEARSPSSPVVGSLIDTENLKDGNGKFVILDYPSEAALSYVELGDLDGLSIEPVEMPELTEDDIDENVRSWLIYYGKEVERTEGTVASGDRVYMKYSSAHDGEPLEGYSTEGAVIRLGLEEEPVGFTENVAGMSVGETRTFTSGFAEDWPDEDVAGMADVEFTVEILAVMDLPELDDGNISDITDGEYATVSDFREGIRASLASMDEQVYRDAVYGEVLDALAGCATFRSVPKELLEWYASIQMYYYQMSADQAGTTIEDYLEGLGLGDSPSKVANAIADTGTEAVRRYALLTAVAERAGITYSEDDEDDVAELEYRCFELMEGFGGYMDRDAIESVYKLSNLANDVVNKKTIDWLIGNIRQEHVENSVENVENSVENVDNEGS